MYFSAADIQRARDLRQAILRHIAKFGLNIMQDRQQSTFAAQMGGQNLVRSGSKSGGVQHEALEIIFLMPSGFDQEINIEYP
jgi:hypothetical protein